MIKNNEATLKHLIQSFNTDIFLINQTKDNFLFNVFVFDDNEISEKFGKQFKRNNMFFLNKQFILENKNFERSYEFLFNGQKITSTDGAFYNNFKKYLNELKNNKDIAEINDNDLSYVIAKLEIITNEKMLDLIEPMNDYIKNKIPQFLSLYNKNYKSGNDCESLFNDFFNEFKSDFSVCINSKNKILSTLFTYLNQDMLDFTNNYSFLDNDFIFKICNFFKDVMNKQTLDYYIGYLCGINQFYSFCKSDESIKTIELYRTILKQSNNKQIKNVK